MRNRLAPLALIGTLVVCLAGVRAEARNEARAEAFSDAFNEGRSDAAASTAAALRELLEGAKGRREAWTAAPSLIVVTSVMDYASGDLRKGYAATAEQLTVQERDALIADLTRALEDFTGGQIKAFADVRVESVRAGQTVKVLRAGQIVAARYRGVQRRTGSLGYGGRMTRGSQITAAAVIIDRDADRVQKQQNVIRTHELGHALGYNHVESQPSIMNPRAGAGLTDFDREALKAAYLR